MPLGFAANLTDFGANPSGLPFDPTQTSLGKSALKVWYNFSNKSSYTVSSGSSLLTLKDCSGNNANAIVTGTPYLDPGNIYFNRRPTLDITTGQYLQVPTTHTLTTAPLSFVWVGLSNNTVGNGYLYSIGSSYGPNNYQNAGTTYLYMSDNVGDATISGSAPLTNTGVIAISVFNGANSYYYTNAKTAIGSTNFANGNDITSTAIYIGDYYGTTGGTTWNINGNLMQFMAFQGALTASDVSTLLINFGNYYGITIGS